MQDITDTFQRFQVLFPEVKLQGAFQQADNDQDKRRDMADHVSDRDSPDSVQRRFKRPENNNNIQDSIHKIHKQRNPHCYFGHSIASENC